MKTLDALEGLARQHDSFVSLLSDGLYARPVPQAPPPHHWYMQVRDHFFIPASNAEQMRSGYSFPRSRNLQYADAMFADFLSQANGTWLPAAGHTYVQGGKAATSTTWLPGMSQPPPLRSPDGQTARVGTWLGVRA